MKASAPEKIYFGEGDRGLLNIYSIKESSDDIEYTRTDTFIKKACDWLKDFNDFHNIMRYSDCSEVPLERIIEDFRNYIKGE